MEIVLLEDVKALGKSMTDMQETLSCRKSWVLRQLPRT